MAKRKSPFHWDVFVSHSSAQKPLVRAIVHQWRDLGLNVFFDEDTIQPGEDVITAINRACERSRHTVLMISPGALASPWFIAELKGAGYLAAAANRDLLIPVLLEDVAEDEIPVNVRRLVRIDLTDPATRRDQYHRLLESLGITARPLPDFPLLESPGARLTAVVQKKPVLEAGTMPPESPYYIERQVERIIREIFENPGSTVTIRGYRQSDKSSMLARLYSWAIAADRACCILDFQDLDAEEFQATKDFFPALAQSIALGLDLDVDPRTDWAPRLGAKKNLTVFLERQVLAKVDRPVLLLFDEADLTFPYRAVCEALFSTLRSWHNKRASDLEGKTWRKLGLVVAHSTEPSLWIKDLNQSPFKNVAHEFLADDFDENEVAEPDARYGRKLQETAKVEDLIKLVGGHPYLVRLALYTLASRPCSFAVLEGEAIDEDGPFASHLGHLSNILHNDDRLLASIRRILKSGKCDDEILFQRLWSVGLIRGKDRNEVWLRYKIYDDYFRRKLL